jgi:hypothetical protein
MILKAKNVSSTVNGMNSYKTANVKGVLPNAVMVVSAKKTATYVLILSVSYVLSGTFVKLVLMELLR